MPVVETIFMSQHGQGAPSHFDEYIIGESLEAPPSSESPVRLQNPTNLMNSSNKTTPTHSPRNRSRLEGQHEGQSFQSEVSPTDDVRALQSEIRRKKVALDEARRRCMVAELELQTGKDYSERRKSCKLEEEFHLSRRALATRVSSRQDHGEASSDRLKQEVEQLRTALEHKVGLTQTRDLALAHKEAGALNLDKAKLKEHITSVWTDYQNYKGSADSHVKDLEAQLSEQRLKDSSSREASSEDSELLQKHAELQRQLTALQADLHQVRLEQAKRDSEIALLRGNLKEAEAVQRGLKELLLGKDKEITQLSAKVESLKTESDKLRDIKKENSSAKDQASNLQKTNDAQHAKISTLEKELQDALAQIGKLEQRKTEALKVDASVECDLLEEPPQVETPRPITQTPTVQAAQPIREPEVPKDTAVERTKTTPVVEVPPRVPEPAVVVGVAPPVQNPEVPEQPEEMMDFASEANPFDFFDKASSRTPFSPPPPPPQPTQRVSPVVPKRTAGKPASNLFAVSKPEESDFFELMAQEPVKRKYGNVPKSLFD
jgi:hypothetical protein